MNQCRFFSLLIINLVISRYPYIIFGYIINCMSHCCNGQTTKQPSKRIDFPFLLSFSDFFFEKRTCQLSLSALPDWNLIVRIELGLFNFCCVVSFTKFEDSYFFIFVQSISMVKLQIYHNSMVQIFSFYSINVVISSLYSERVVSFQGCFNTIIDICNIIIYIFYF